LQQVPYSVPATPFRVTTSDAVTIKGTLLLIHGDTDRTVPVANAYALHRQASQPRLCIYAGIGHAVGPMRAQAPQRLLVCARTLPCCPTNTESA
jgi:hypothetical protein